MLRDLTVVVITMLLPAGASSQAISSQDGKRRIAVSVTEVGAQYKAGATVDRMQYEYEKPQSSSGVEIVGISWRGAYCILGNCEEKGAFSVDVKNTGTKMVTAVHWDFYLVDSVRQQFYDHFKFVTNDKKVLPGSKPVRLTKRFDYHIVPDYLRAHAEIMKVVYSDGSVWTKPEDKP